MLVLWKLWLFHAIFNIKSLQNSSNTENKYSVTDQDIFL